MDEDEDEEEDMVGASVCVLCLWLLQVGVQLGRRAASKKKIGKKNQRGRSSIMFK
jgi:hypothetical protein